MSTFEQHALCAARAVIDAHAERLHGIGQRLLLALECDDIDEVGFIAEELVGYGDVASHARFHNAIGNYDSTLGSDA